jgi:hypothetical protein
MYAKFML